MKTKEKVDIILWKRLMKVFFRAIIISKEDTDMIYLKRKIDDFLVSWKENPDRKPLIVKGPRQVG